MTVWYTYQTVSHKNICFSWWRAQSRPKHVEIDKYTNNKYTKNKLCTKLALFTRLYRDAQSAKHKKMYNCVYCVLYCLYCVFCIVSLMYVYSYLFCLYWCKDYCHRVVTIQLQLVIIIIIIIIIITPSRKAYSIGLHSFKAHWQVRMWIYELLSCDSGPLSATRVSSCVRTLILKRFCVLPLANVLFPYSTTFLSFRCGRICWPIKGFFVVRQWNLFHPSRRRDNLKIATTFIEPPSWVIRVESMYLCTCVIVYLFTCVLVYLCTCLIQLYLMVELCR